MVDYHQEQLQQQIEFRVSFAVGFLAAKIYEGGRIETYTIYWLGALSLQSVNQFQYLRLQLSCIVTMSLAFHFSLVQVLHFYKYTNCYHVSFSCILAAVLQLVWR